MLISQIAVSLAMALTMMIVAAIAGPPLFEAHMHLAGQAIPDVLAHSEEAFITAGTLALIIGLVISVSGASVVSVLIVRRLRKALTDLGAATSRIAEGDYDLRVGSADSRELEILAKSFNSMAGKLAAVEGSRRRLLTDLAHEIRTPLASMEICVESLEDGALEPGPQAWRVLSDQIRRVSHLADDLGQVSAAEEGRLNLKPRLLSTSALLRSAVQSAQDGYDRKGVALRIGSVPTRSMVYADPARVGQILANLLSNSLRHTPAGGGVTLDATTDGQVTRISVVDNGEGIAPEHLPHIFERFYRADTARDRQHGGTGVGLAISHAIAKAHGGRLSATSPGLGAGASFTLELPRRDQGLTESS
jgi:signal transduction histidine kinase